MGLISRSCFGPYAGRCPPPQCPSCLCGWNARFPSAADSCSRFPAPASSCMFSTASSLLGCSMMAMDHPHTHGSHSPGASAVAARIPRAARGSAAGGGSPAGLGPLRCRSLMLLPLFVLVLTVAAALAVILLLLVIIILLLHSGKAARGLSCEQAFLPMPLRKAPCQRCSRDAPPAAR